MIEITDKTKCMGCHACYNVCPKFAINMVADKEGFLYPNVSVEKCVNCGMCLNICPSVTKLPLSLPNFESSQG